MTSLYDKSSKVWRQEHNALKIYIKKMMVLESRQELNVAEETLDS